MANITKELAEKIAEKLGAVKNSKKNRPHDLYVVYHEGVRIAQFGICRGSNKNDGHDFIPSKIHVTPRQARLLGQCPMSYQDWVNEMIGKGLIAAPAQADEGSDAEN
ncbi:MAG TPA: hypothetical protein VMV10_16240 [Pirellulales bacterium]|nr:hypothetical protein [Pirellulales bacterium]